MQLEFCGQFNQALDSFRREVKRLLPSVDEPDAKEILKWLKEAIELEPKYYAGSRELTYRNNTVYAENLPDAINRVLLNKAVVDFIAKVEETKATLDTLNI